TAPSDAPDHLGDIGRGEPAVARVDPLGREGQEDILSDHHADGLQPRENDLFRGARKGGALEDEELAATKMRQEALQGRDDEREVRLLALPERGGDADDEGIRLPDLI